MVPCEHEASAENPGLAGKEGSGDGAASPPMACLAAVLCVLVAFLHFYLFYTGLIPPRLCLEMFAATWAATSAWKAIWGGREAGLEELFGVLADARQAALRIAFLASGGFLQVPPVQLWAETANLCVVHCNYAVSYGILSLTAIHVSYLSFSNIYEMLFEFDGDMSTKLQWSLTAFLWWQFSCWSVNLTAHRYFAHRCFATSRLFQVVLSFLGVLAGQRGCLWWASLHRRHHQLCEREGDPHSPKLFGLPYAHMGWLLDRRHFGIHLDHCRDFWEAQPEVLLADVFAQLLYFRWTGLVARTVGVPLSVLLIGHSFSLHWEFFINSLCHVSESSSETAWQRLRYLLMGGGDGAAEEGGRPRGEAAACRDSRDACVGLDLWWVGVLNAGEGFHAEHHRNPRCARHAHGAWRHADPVYQTVRLFEAMGLVWDVCHPRGDDAGGKAE